MCLDSGADYLSFNPSFAPFYPCDIGQLKLCLSFLIFQWDKKSYNINVKIGGVVICTGHKALPLTGKYNSHSSCCIATYTSEQNWMLTEMHWSELLGNFKKSYIYASSNIVFCLSNKFVFDYKSLVTDNKWHCVEFSKLCVNISQKLPSLDICVNSSHSCWLF